MHEDSTTPRSPWSDDPVSHPAGAATPTHPIAPPRLEPVSADTDGGRLHRLLWIFALLTVALVAPSVIGRIEYARTAARERARHDVALENLGDYNLEQNRAANRLIPQIVGPSVVSVRTHNRHGLGQGSGVIVNADGYIVTNNHVMEGVQTAEIQLSDGRRGPASLVGADPLTDIAVLKTELGNLTPAEWGDSDDLEVGDPVWAVGSPFGLPKTVTSGIVSAKERRGIGDNGGIIQEFLQTDAAVNPGNSGGPLVDIHGQVVGINTAIIGLAYQGISFAVPSELARASYEQLLEHGYVERGFLGVGPGRVPDDVARELGIERGVGVWVYHVSPDTPAADAGLRPNDVILQWNGEEFSDPTLFSRAVAATPIGDEAEVTIIRPTRTGPKEVELTVRVGARPEE